MRIIAACVIALTVAVAQRPCQQLHASEASQITFSCDGKVTGSQSVDPNKGDPITKVGVVINLTDQTVSFNSYVVKITKVDAAVVTFEGQSQTPIMGTMSGTYVSGSIDRVTGAMTATTVAGTNLTSGWELYCKPATRMF
jgi:hypothetical protein